MKPKFLLKLLISFLIILSSPFCCSSAQFVTGEIISAIILQERIHLTIGDKAVTNLGSKHGVIKGDIFVVTTPKDVMK